MNHGHTGHVRFLTSEELGPDNGGSSSGGGRNAATAVAGRTAPGAANPRLHGRKDPTAGEDWKGIFFLQFMTLEKAGFFGIC